MSTMKKIVKYKPHSNDRIFVGVSAEITETVDHTSKYVCNGRPVITSMVVFHDKETGEFETMNTLYKPV